VCPMNLLRMVKSYLTLSFDATSALKVGGNDYIEFKGRFGGMGTWTSWCPVDRVLKANLWRAKSKAWHSLCWLVQPVAACNRPRTFRQSRWTTVILWTNQTPPNPDGTRPNGRWTTITYTRQVIFVWRKRRESSVTWG